MSNSERPKNMHLDRRLAEALRAIGGLGAFGLIGVGAVEQGGLGAAVGAVLGLGLTWLILKLTNDSFPPDSSRPDTAEHFLPDDLP